jgi:hypothetical protein
MLSPYIMWAFEHSELTKIKYLHTFCIGLRYSILCTEFGNAGIHTILSDLSSATFSVSMNGLQQGIPLVRKRLPTHGPISLLLRKTELTFHVQSNFLYC